MVATSRRAIAGEIINVDGVAVIVGAGVCLTGAWLIKPVVTDTTTRETRGHSRPLNARGRVLVRRGTMEHQRRT
ncbi:MAG: hypothetical protein DMG00_11745 [Acidobacteria bacterium]|nr:MAG: hypothetical protein DMG00_11745 [Acidobacteriota bacterium]